MDHKCKWLMALLLPLVASCSSPLGIVKKNPELKQESQQAASSTDKAPAIATKEDGAFHIVGPGETLRHICDVYGLDLDKVAKINKILPPHSLKEGETVFLPAQALLCADSDSWNQSAGSRGKRTEEKVTKKQACSILADVMRGQRDPIVPSLKFPVPSGILSSPFGHRWGRFHQGLDIAAPVGRPVLACADGRVVFTGTRKRFRRYGNTVLIDHGKGVYTYYAHLSDILVKKNQKVRQGHKIALVGETGRATGPHLHLEVRVANKMYNPLAYFAPAELSRTRFAKNFSGSPMGPVRARWRIPDLLTAKR
ncbi:MAG: peptidoglycan DD-metalloendopeptidase family protein [Desulfomonile tiedjei]|nr:peptidoglycan DD-metalloendopeptidase family protein [Desulfomonile tiedjei]